jgi:plasmid stabilization system protein ParE
MNKLFGKQKRGIETEWTILWSKRAKETYFIVLDYITNNWSSREVIQFMNRVEAVIMVIKKNPRIYTGSSANINLRKAIIDKNNSLFYLINTDQKHLVILTFYDNRQDPQNFKF